MRKSFILFVFLFITFSCFSQESYINKKWKIKAGMSPYRTTVRKGGKSNNEKANNFQLEVSYGVLDYLELGIYGGYGANIFVDNNLADNLTNITYGFNINLHILPFITQGEILKFIDTYVTANWGTNFYKVNPIKTIDGYGGKYSDKNKKTIDYVRKFDIVEQGIGAGVAIYPIKKLGLFGEYVYGKYFFDNNKRFRAGLIYRF